MSYGDIISILQGTIRMSVPLILTALAGLYAERSGVVDIGLEGKLLAAAFAGAVRRRIVREEKPQAFRDRARRRPDAPQGFQIADAIAEFLLRFAQRTSFRCLIGVKQAGASLDHHAVRAGKPGRQTELADQQHCAPRCIIG